MKRVRPDGRRHAALASTVLAAVRAMAPGARVWFWLFAVASGAVVAGVAIFAAVRLVDDVLFETRHVTTNAVVISIRETRTCLSNQGCTDDRYPTVAFLTARGASVQAETADVVGFTHRDDYAVGQTTTVHYDPADPADVRLRAGLDKYDLLSIGYLVAGVGFIVRWLLRRRRDAPGVPADPAVS